MNEKTPLLNGASINDGGVLPKFISNPNNQTRNKMKFQYAVPSQESEQATKERFISIRICYLVMFLSSVSFTISITSMWPYLLIVLKIIIYHLILIILKIKLYKD
jgi:hypothetical protein